MATASLARKRAQERIVKEREIFLKEEFNAARIARWEQQTLTRIEKNDVMSRTKKKIEDDAKKLDERQNQMKEMYERDAFELQKELEESTNISIEDRMKAIREKATRLQEKRAKEKEEFVNACYNRQWREGCDDVRTLNARAITDKLVFDRKHALDLKHSAPDESGGAEKNRLTQELERKEKEDALEKKRKNKEIKLALDEQVRINKDRKERASEDRRREEREQLERWKLENNMEKEKELKSLKKALARGEQTMKSNSDRLRDREKNESQKRKEETIMLNYALEKERADIEAEKKRIQQNKGASEEYKTFLHKQMNKNEQSSFSNDEEEAVQNIWQKRHADMKAEEEKRNKMMLEVNASREDQIRAKKQYAEELRQKESIEVENNIKIWEKEKQSEQDKEEEKKQRTVANMLWNKKAMEEVSKHKMLEKQKQFLFQKQMAHAEQKYQSRVEREAGRATTYFPRKVTS